MDLNLEKKVNYSNINIEFLEKKVNYLNNKFLEMEIKFSKLNEDFIKLDKELKKKKLTTKIKSIYSTFINVSKTPFYFLKNKITKNNDKSCQISDHIFNEKCDWNIITKKIDITNKVYDKQDHIWVIYVIKNN